MFQIQRAVSLLARMNMDYPGQRCRDKGGNVVSARRGSIDRFFPPLQQRSRAGIVCASKKQCGATRDYDSARSPPLPSPPPLSMYIPSEISRDTLVNGNSCWPVYNCRSRSCLFEFKPSATDNYVLIKVITKSDRAGCIMHSARHENSYRRPKSLATLRGALSFAGNHD